MSKSLRRVVEALRTAGLSIEPLEMGQDTRTAEQAARAAECAVGQIVKSIIFRGEKSGQTFLFLTSGSRQVSAEKAACAAGEPLGRADAGFVRAQTGFAIGGVSPIGHLTRPVCFFDPSLLQFDQVWAAAGTPRHIFPISPTQLLALTSAKVVEFTENLP